MNSHCHKTYASRFAPLGVACIILSLVACSNKAALRDKERARYDNLESELINQQKAKDQRLREEFRIRNTPDQADSNNLAGQADSDDLAAEDAQTNSDESEKAQSVVPTPAVTQVVIAQPPEGIVGGGWSRQNFPNPVDGSPICAVVSIPVTVQNGRLDTQVRIVISESSVFLRTDATFNPEALEAGFQVDAGLPIAFDRFENELTAVVDDNYSRLIRDLRTGSTLVVAFAYEPQLSSSEMHIVELTLESFDQVWSKNDQCDELKDG